jgi:hypothetical protein
MSRSIFLINADGALTELQEQPYESEALLQRLLADHPGVLTGDTPGAAPAPRWLLITREADVPDSADGASRWSVDHLFLDQDAVPTLVEVKRSTDTRIRREVVGQMLDYAANAVVYWPVDKLRTAFETRCARQRIDSDAELGRVLAEGENAEAFWQKAKTNLQAGRVRLVFVADTIPPELRRVVEFLNEQMDPAEVLAIEVRQYLAGGLRTLVPSVVGQTAEAQQRKGTTAGSTSAGQQWDENSFFDDLLRTSGAEIVQVARELLQWAQSRTTRVWWGKGQRAGSFIPVYSHNGTDYQLFVVWSSGTFEVYFQWLAQRPVFADEGRRRALLDRLNAIPGVMISQDALRRRPNVPLSAFVDPAARAQLVAALDWCLAEIRAE